MVMMMTLMVTEIMKIMAMGDNYEYGNGGWHNFAAVVNMAVLVNMLAQRLLGKYSVSRYGLVKIATLVMLLNDDDDDDDDAYSDDDDGDDVVPFAVGIRQCCSFWHR